MKKFEDFIKKGIVREQTPDYERSKDLISESDRKFRQIQRVIQKLGIDNENANDIIEDCYDAIIGLMRAIMLFNGYNSSGKGAHEAEVYFLKNLGFPETEIDFINRLRYFRNGITYYGKNFDKEYATQVNEFMKKIIPKLKKHLEGMK